LPQRRRQIAAELVSLVPSLAFDSIFPIVVARFLELRSHPLCLLLGGQRVVIVVNRAAGVRIR
jgi:hypothetical protein